MELLGSILLTLALTLLVVMFISRPFFRPDLRRANGAQQSPENALEHRFSGLMAERDRILTALQELEFDYVLGKVPAEDYPEQRAALLYTGAAVLRQLDEIRPSEFLLRGEHGGERSAEDRIEAAVAARRADAADRNPAERNPAAGKQRSEADVRLEELIAARKRQRADKNPAEKSAGFCPGCGKPVQKSDKFCPRCGAKL